MKKAILITFIMAMIMIQVASATGDYFRQRYDSGQAFTVAGRERGCTDQPTPFPESGQDFRKFTWKTTFECQQCPDTALVNWYKETELGKWDPDIRGESTPGEQFVGQFNTIYYYECYCCDEIKGVACDKSECYTDTSYLKCEDGYLSDTPTNCAEKEYCSGGKCTAEGDCKESWACEAFSECKSGYMKRDCIDINDCGSTKDRPAILKACDTENMCPFQPEAPCTTAVWKGYPSCVWDATYCNNKTKKTNTTTEKTFEDCFPKVDSKFKECIEFDDETCKVTKNACGVPEGTPKDEEECDQDFKDTCGNGDEFTIKCVDGHYQRTGKECGADIDGNSGWNYIKRNWELSAAIVAMVIIIGGLIFYSGKSGKKGKKRKS